MAVGCCCNHCCRLLQGRHPKAGSVEVQEQQPRAVPPVLYCHTLDRRCHHCLHGGAVCNIAHGSQQLLSRIQSGCRLCIKQQARGRLHQLQHGLAAPLHLWWLLLMALQLLQCQLQHRVAQLRPQDHHLPDCVQVTIL
jgi:hypothetical protein